MNYPSRSRRSCHPGLLVSVHTPAEASAALAGGADLIDIKEPARGPLGRADPAVIEAIVRRVAGRRPVSAALGELAHGLDLDVPAGLSFVKCGLAGWQGRDWRPVLNEARCRAPAPLVVAAYADWLDAQAPPLHEIVVHALACSFTAVLIDTYVKEDARGRRTLLDLLPLARVRELCAACRGAGVRLALAGSLGPDEMRRLLQAGLKRPECPPAPDWLAVRGAACGGGRLGTVRADHVRRLASLLRRAAPRSAEMPAGASAAPP